MLRKFAGIREDGMNPEKLISDPSFFFEHWRSSIHLASSRRRSIAIVVERDVSDQLLACWLKLLQIIYSVGEEFTRVQPP